MDDANAEVHRDREWMRLAHLYSLGLTLDDEQFRNAVVDALVEKVTESDRYPTGIAADTHDCTNKGDKLRSLIVDLHVWKDQGRGVRAPYDDAAGPQEFVQDVLSGLADAGGDVYNPDIQAPWKIDRCKYHVHDNTSTCTRTVGTTLDSRGLRNAYGPTGQLWVPDGNDGSVRCIACNRSFPSVVSFTSHNNSSAVHKENVKALAARASQRSGS